ncbi:DUF2877 domain-containing protein [Bacteroidota bacterium]
MQNINITYIGDSLPDGKFNLHSSFNRVVNFINDKNEIVAISENEEFLSPNTIIIKDDDFSNIKNLNITDDKIYIDNQFVLLENCTVYKSKICYKELSEKGLSLNISHFIENYIKYFNKKSLGFLLDHNREEFFSSSFEKAYVMHIKYAFSELVNGNYLSGIKRFKGSGFGLTPSGDDFIAGVLLALLVNQSIYNKDLNTLRESIKDIAIGNNPISNALINNSYKGALYLGFKNFQNAFLFNYSEIETALQQLIAIGETSGSDILTGYILTLKHKFGI